MASEVNPISSEKPEKVTKVKKDKSRTIKVDYNIVMNIQLPTEGQVGITIFTSIFKSMNNAWSWKNEL